MNVKVLFIYLIQKNCNTICHFTEFSNCDVPLQWRSSRVSRHDFYQTQLFAKYSGTRLIPDRNGVIVLFELIYHELQIL